MSPIIIMGAIVLLPIVVLTLLRVNATAVFLSLCVGSVLVQYLGGNAISLVTALSPHASQLSENSIEIGLLLAPAALTTVFMFHSVRRVKVVLNIIPAITVGALLLVVVEPLFSPGLQGSFNHASVWNNFVRAEPLLVGGAVLINLAFLWIDRRQSKSSKDSSKKR